MGAGRRHRSQGHVVSPTNQVKPPYAIPDEPWIQNPLGKQLDTGMICFGVDVPSRSPLETATVPLMQMWDEKRYWFQSVLVPKTSSGGKIELYLDLHTGTTVVAKRFPREQLCDSIPSPNFMRGPWQEIEITKLLGSPVQGRTLRGVCTCHGVFRDEKGDALLVSEYFPGGDLFELASNFGEPGPQREAKAWPILCSLLAAVVSLHTADVAHGDVSLENALWPGSQGEVVLIDFETTLLGNLGVVSGTRGKPSYQAPEMHTERSYDARAADLFSCGVVAYMLAIGADPWTSTKPGVCDSFAYAKQCGVEAFLEKKCVRVGNERKPARQFMSNKLTYLLHMLLNLEPMQRQGAFALIDNLEGKGWRQDT